MSINNSTLTAGSTAMAITPTGGSSVTLRFVKSQNNTVEYVVASDTDVRTRRRIKVTAVPPVKNKAMPSGYSPGYQKVELICPIILANGEIDYPKMEIRNYKSIESTAAQIDELKRLGAQVLLLSAWSDLYQLDSAQ